MRKAISAAGILVLAGGARFLPAGRALLYVLGQRRKELGKGELEDAKNY